MKTGKFLVLACAIAMTLNGCGERKRSAPASEGAEAPVATVGFHGLATPDGATVGAIFGALVAESADTLLAVSVPASVAARAELHEMSENAAGQMEMRAVEWLALPEHERVELRPGGHHVMLVELRAPLVPERSIPLTLRFARGGERVLEVPVRQP